MNEYRLNNYILPGPMQPVGEQVLVRLGRKDDKTAGGLFMASAEKEKPREGVVVAVGPGNPNEISGVMMTPPVNEGQLVLLSEYTGERVEYCGAPHIFVSGESVLGTFEGSVATADGFKPLRDRLLVEVAEQATETSTGIALSLDDDTASSNQGKVVAVGDGLLLASGEVQSMGVAVGDHVLFEGYQGAEAMLDGKTYKVVAASKCLAKW